MKKILVISFLLLLVGCSAQQRKTSDLAKQLSTQSPAIVLQQLQTIAPSERDYAQFHLNVGLLQLLSGDFSASIETLTLAKQEMAALTALSLSETAGAGTISETLRSYSGYPTDRVMVHTILAFSYLFNGDIDGARVEMLQADISMKKLADKDSLSGQLASSHLLAGIVYEMLDEQSNALISYKYSEDIIKQRQLAVPVALKQALLRMSYRVDRRGQYITYKKRYSGFPTPKENSKSQVFALYFDGIVSNKQENTILVPSGNGEQVIRISMPSYPNVSSRLSTAKLSDASQQVTTQLIESLEALAREDLQAEYPSILLLTTTRAIAKYELVAQAEKQDPLFGALVNFVTVLTEVADLRSWNMLPSNIQFSYLETVDPSLTINKGRAEQYQVTLDNGSKNLLLISSLATPIFHYQQ